MNKIVQSFWKAFFYTKRVGIRGLLGRVQRKFQPETVRYEQWLRRHGINSRKKLWDLEQIRHTKPTIDVLVLENCVNVERLRNSLKKQIWQPLGLYSDAKECKGEYVLLVSEDI